MSKASPEVSEAGPGPGGRARLLAATSRRLRSGETIRVADICAEAQVSAGLVYKYFADRDDLVAEAYAALFAGQARIDIALLREMAADPAGPVGVREAVLVIARRTLEVDRDDVRWGRLEAVAQARTNPYYAARVESVRSELVEEYCRLLSDAMSGADEADVRALAEIASGIALGITAMADPDLTASDRDRLANMWASMIAHAVTRR